MPTMNYYFMQHQTPVQFNTWEEFWLYVTTIVVTGVLTVTLILYFAYRD